MNAVVLMVGAALLAPGPNEGPGCAPEAAAAVTPDASVEGDLSVKLVARLSGIERYAAGIINLRPRAAPQYASGGLQAWYADDGVIVLSDRLGPDYQIAMECIPNSARSFGAPEQCSGVSRQFAPHLYVEFTFPAKRMKDAQLLVNRAESLARERLAVCGRALTPAKGR